MRNVTMLVVASMFATGLASAQMKVTQSTPSGKTEHTITPTLSAQQPLESARRIKRDEAMKLVKANKAVYVDVRSKESYDAGHIKGAINIPESEIIGSRLKAVPPNKMIITYCA